MALSKIHPKKLEATLKSSETPSFSKLKNKKFEKINKKNLCV